MKKKSLLYSSIRDYLLLLEESGVEGIPEDSASGAVSPSDTPEESAPVSVRTSSGKSAARKESMAEIRKSLGDCHRCRLGAQRANLVFGTGDPHAGILFVGEGPGADEDRLGEPFVGEAGQVLNRLISAMGLKREDVYICNVVKCRPPGNRNPEGEEIAECLPFLLRQIRSAAPGVVIALGKVAANALLGNKDPISKLRGRFHDCNGTPLMPTYHPSYLLRNRGDSKLYWEVWEDMVQVLQYVGLPVPEKPRKS